MSSKIAAGQMNPSLPGRNSGSVLVGIPGYVLGMDPAAITAAFDELDAAVDRALTLDFEALQTVERLALLERVERIRRRLPAVEHPLINQLANQATAEELGGKLGHAFAEWALVSRAEANRRIHEAADLGHRNTLTGGPLAPVMAGTATAQREGKLGSGQVSVIRRFYRRLPSFVDTPTRDSAEAKLSQEGTQYRPEQLAKLADRMADCLNPDGTYSDDDRARRRGLTLGKQQADGMSQLRGWVTPELRATIEAALAKLAAPGMCNPYHDTPCIDGTPSQQAIDSDTRSTAQRNHDGLNAAIRALLASGNLGQHNGLPASIVVTTTLSELEAATGRGLTGGGTILPMSDVIRLSRHARHYLAIFEKGKALALYHTKRLASPAQRIVLYGRDLGCTAPGCDVPGYYSEVHHVVEWAKCHRTDVNELTFACGCNHRLVRRGGWLTRRNSAGETEWIPPPHLDRGQPRVNTFHHPERLLPPADENDAH